MNCEGYPLFRFSRGELNPAGARRTAEHVAECDTCSQRLQVMVALQEYHLENGLRRRRRRRWWLVAAAVLALAVVTVFVQQSLRQDGPPKPSVIAVKIPYPLVLLNNRSDAETDRRSAYQAYLAGDYSRAEILLRRSTHEMDLLLRGVSLYMLERWEEAVSVLRGVSHESAWRQPALWYEANALIRLGQWEEARRILQALAGEDGEYTDRATALVEQLGEGP